MLQIVTIGIGYPRIERKYFQMKKTLITTLILFTSLVCLKADAGMVIMDYNGETIVRPNIVERNLLINSNDGGEYDIAVKPLDDALVRSDGEVRIPLNYVYLNNNTEDVFMRYNEYSTIFRRAIMGGIPKNVILKVRDYGMLPAGVYNLNIEIQTVDPDTSTVNGTSTFNLQLIVPKSQDITFHGESAQISIGTKDAFSHRKIPTDTNPILTINSNCDWVVTLDTTDFGETAGNYYIRTVAASPNIQQRLQERVLITPGKEIIIAKGKAPANNEYVSIECSVEGKDGKILRAGSYVNNLDFVIMEDRGR